jgi:hypothetical protein
MAVGDLCYKSGGSLAYSKVDGESLIYKGTWRFGLSWTGAYGSEFDESPKSADFSTAQTSVWLNHYTPPVYYPPTSFWTYGPIWVRWKRTAPLGSSLSWSRTEYTYQGNYVNMYDWYLSSNYVLIFWIGPWGSYGGGYGVRAFGSSSPSGSFTQIADNTDISNTIGGVEITTEWV